MSWGKSKRHLGRGLGQGPPRNPSLPSCSSVHTIISFPGGSIPFPPYFFQSAQPGQQQEEQKEKQMSSTQVLEFFAVKVGCECPLQSHMAPHLKDEETWLHLWLICECPKKEIELQKGFALWLCFGFKLVRFCWRFTTQSWVCGFNILTSLVKVAVKNSFVLSYFS